MKRFSPCLDILPAPQQRLWPDLAEVPRHFVLYGGTAIALRLGHRQSLDFDFFTSESIISEQLISLIPCVAGAQILQNEKQTLTVVVNRGGRVKLSFFGGLQLGRVGEPEETEDGVMLVASLLDLAGLKAAVVQKRAESKDYLDMVALLQHGISLPAALGAAQALYREQFNPLFTLKSMTYFEDGDLPLLSTEYKHILTTAASAPLEIQQIQRLSDFLAPAEWVENPGLD